MLHYIKKHSIYYYLTIIILCCLYSLPANATMKLSLNKALTLAKKAPMIHLSQSQINEAKAELSIAKGMFLPMVSINHSLIKTNDPVHVFGAKMQQTKFEATDFNINSLNNPNALTHSSTQMQLVQPIINGGVDIYNYKAAKHNVKAKQHAHNFNLATLKFNVRNLYYHATSLSQKINVNNVAINKLKELEKSYELIQAPTSANTTNYFVAQSIRKSLEAQKTYLTANLQSLKRTLLNTIGENPEQNVILTDSLSTHFDNTQNHKQTKREDILATNQNVLAAQDKLTATKWTYSPRVDFVSSYNIYSGDYESSADSYMVGVNVSWPLFQGWRQGFVKKALAQKEQAKEFNNITKLNAKTGKKNATQNLASGKQQLSQMNNAVLQATKALNLAKTRYEEGTLPLFDYSQSIQNWTEIKHAAIDTKLNLAITHSQVLFERGDK